MDEEEPSANIIYDRVNFIPNKVKKNENVECGIFQSFYMSASLYQFGEAFLLMDPTGCIMKLWSLSNLTTIFNRNDAQYNHSIEDFSSFFEIYEAIVDQGLIMFAMRFKVLRPS